MALRDSVRALIIDEQDQILLVRFHWEGIDPEEGFWAHPGGGIEPGETRLAALQRELREETGLVIEDLGPEIWTKTAYFPMTDWEGQVDHIHLLRTAHFDPAPEMSVAQLAAEGVHEIRWWSPSELNKPSFAFSPRSLPDLMRHLDHDGVPDVPLELSGF